MKFNVSLVFLAAVVSGQVGSQIDSNTSQKGYGNKTSTRIKQRGFGLNRSRIGAILPLPPVITPIPAKPIAEPVHRITTVPIGERAAPTAEPVESRKCGTIYRPGNIIYQ